MASKLSFRARALDAQKPMPVFINEDIPEVADYAAIARAVPQMPTGMEKEEEHVSFGIFNSKITVRHDEFGAHLKTGK